MRAIKWGLPSSVKVGGENRRIQSDYDKILDIFSVINSPELADNEKTIKVLDTFYPDLDSIPPESWKEAIEQCFWFINGGEALCQNGESSPKLVDWEQDYPLIIAAVNTVLGFDARTAKHLHWWTFRSAYMEIKDCTFAQVVRIRDKLSQEKALDKHDREWYQKNRRLVDLKNKYTSSENDQLKKWGAV